MVFWNALLFLVFFTLFVLGVYRLRVLETRALHIIARKHEKHLREASLPRPRAFRSLTGSNVVSQWLERGTDRFEDAEFSVLSKDYRRTIILLFMLLTGVLIYGILTRLLPVI